MPDIIFKEFEEKMMRMLTEMEFLRQEVQRLGQENSALKFERESSMQRLQGLISLFDTINSGDNTVVNVGVQVGKPVLVQG